MTHTPSTTSSPIHTTRHIERIVHGIATQDGAGVQLTRMIGTPSLPMLDPFLMLDAFRSDQPDDYIAGFPPHPHRGFETVTYLLAGRMRHKDNAGHEGIIEAGGIQWMSAARGIIHSEMPEQQDGLLEGFQLWVNLPAQHKMDFPSYQEYPADKIPIQTESNGTIVRVIAGTTDQGTQGVIQQPLTEPLYLDIHLPAQHTFTQSLPIEHHAFLYVIMGEITLDDQEGQSKLLHRDDLAVLSLGATIQLQANETDCRLLLIAAKPIHEPVARGGPFVMNTKAEVRQAFYDFEQGLF
ncbi:MAG: pirin family protein [Zetaproteobacteria bacterium]|nr:pirin family protein [Zetaproteobacteria bacterium]